MELNDFTPKELTYPGMILSSDIKLIPGRGVIETEQGLTALFIGLKEIRGKYIHIIPLKGMYNPQIGHKVIGRIITKTPTKWIVDINSKGVAILKPQDAVARTSRNGKYARDDQRRKGSFEQKDEDAMNMFNVGDYIMAKILSGDRIEDPEISTLGQYLGKINDGYILEISPPKIPRIIGKRGSMIKILKEMTRSRIFVTQNGRIWINGRNEKYERILMEAIFKIEREAHTSGLTDRIKYFLTERKKELNLE
jgi:exosome complex component RRP4